MRKILIAATIAAAAAAAPALAVTNLIVNGSFEAAGTTGAGAFTGWSKMNTPTGLSGDADVPASVIVYNSTAAYPVSAYGEAVTPDNIVGSGSPDAVGNYAAYFVGDYSVNETLYQLTYLTPGNYRVGFSYYLTQNGLNNPNNASLDVSVLGVLLVSSSITNASLGQTWFYADVVGQVTTPGFYKTSLIYNSNGYPSKDAVVDRVFAIRTGDLATTMIPPTQVLSVPEPATWAMLLTGFGMVGVGLRRRRVAAA